jgi:hypothetical protein
MLRSEFPTDIALSFGALAPPLEEQLKAQGLSLHNAQRWQGYVRSWNQLRIGGFLTDNESRLVANRLTKAIALDCAYEDAAEQALAFLSQPHVPEPLHTDNPPVENPDPACPMPSPAEGKTAALMDPPIRHADTPANDQLKQYLD